MLNPVNEPLCPGPRGPTPLWPMEHNDGVVREIQLNNNVFIIIYGKLSIFSMKSFIERGNFPGDVLRLLALEWIFIDK